MPINPSHLLANRGFTLIETIIGIVVLGISFAILTSLIHPLSQQSAEQLHQVKAAALANSVLNEIQNKAFDNNSDMSGGIIRCGEATAPACTLSNALGPEDGGNGRINDGETSRALFDDVDDYNGLDYGAGQIENSQGAVLSTYLGYQMRIRVCNDANYDGSCSGGNSSAKLITVTITIPTNFSMNFSTYRTNF
jgi:MSHA pilin protein MshD